MGGGGGGGVYLYHDSFSYVIDTFVLVIIAQVGYYPYPILFGNIPYHCHNSCDKQY